MEQIFGNAFVPMTLKNIIENNCLLEDEMKQWDMAKRFDDDGRVRFLLVTLEQRSAVPGFGWCGPCGGHQNSPYRGIQSV